MTRLISAALAASAAMSLTGCASVRTDSQDPITLGVWIVPQREQMNLVQTVLRDNGLDASVSSYGVVVRDEDRLQAARILLTDQRLRESNLLLLHVVAAGTGRMTDEGIVAPIILIGEELDAVEADAAKGHP